MRENSAHNPQAFDLDREIPKLNELAVKGLAEMFDPEEQLFCFRLKRTEGGLVREGVSRRYTIIALLGLYQLESTGLQSPVNIKTTLDHLLRTSDQIGDLGDLGLLLWLCALASPENLERIGRIRNLKSELNHDCVSLEGRTMELAWLLSGLAHVTVACAERASALSATALRVYDLIKDNQAGKGIFGHLSRPKSLAGFIRGQVGSFADQVYPIYALSKFAQAYDRPEALQLAANCADAICQAQGSLGQWWWHYNSSAGSFVEQYPVYSVHQHGMAPMALLALKAASGRDFTPAISKGLQWIFGNNELGCDLRDRSAHVIWRSTYPSGYHRHLNTAASVLRGRGHMRSYRHMKVKFECRPYELGWLLYAHGGRGTAVTQSTVLV
jgi:hypothetical protein